MAQQQDTAHLLHHLVSLLSRESDQLLHAEVNIGLSQYKIMTTLREHPHVQQRIVAHSLGQTEASISRQIKLLTDKGLLRARPNPLNQREHITDLTPRGEQLIDTATETLDTYHAFFFAGLSTKDHSVLHELLGKVHDHICYLDHAA